MTAKKRVPIKLRWHDALRRSLKIPRENPGKQGVVAVASVMAAYADSDGRNSFPAVETVMFEAGASKRTVRAVLRWLVTAGWLIVTAKAKQRRPAVYRLTFPEGAEEHPLDKPQGVPTSILWDGLGGAPGGAPEGAEEHPDIPTPNVSEEEEEGASAPLAGARGAAPSSGGVSEAELFGDGPGPDRSMATPTISAEVAAAVAEVGVRVGAALDSAKVAPAFTKAMASTGWCASVVGVYCVEKLKRRGRKVADPSAFLATDLATRVNGDVTPSARMNLAAAYAELDDVDAQLDDDDIELGHSAPRVLVTCRLADEDVIEHPMDGIPGLWDVKAGQIEQVVETVRGAIDQTREHLRRQRP